MGHEFDVLGIGTYCIDYLCFVSRYPQEDEKLEAYEIEIQGGGNVASACVAASRLGGSVCYHGTVGEDGLTEHIMNGLQSEGVDIAHVKTKRGRNPLAFVVVSAEKASRTILYLKKDIPTFGAQEVDPALIRASRVLLVDFYHEEASLAASRIAHEAGIPVVVDAEKDSPLADEIFSNASDIVASERFALRAVGADSLEDKWDLLEQFADKIKRSSVTITLGNRGSVCLAENGRRKIEQKAFCVDVVDTTGAGDVFHGVYALFLARGYRLEKILELASACAAMKCREMGGRKGIPLQDELLGFLKEYDER
jgi:sulfofructose kinase